MFKILVRTALLATMAIGAAACNRDSSAPGNATANGPEQAIQRSIELTRAGDVAGLVEHMLPPEEFARVKADWVSEKDQAPVDDAARTRFAETIDKLTADDAVESLYKELEPDIRQFDAQYQQQIPTIVAMGRGYLNGMIQQNQGLTASEKEQAAGIIDALAKWVEETRFTDPALVRKALGIVSQSARQLDLKSLDEARALSFEQSAPKLQIAFTGLKQVLEVYGFSIDQTLDTVKTEVVSNDGDRAVVKIDYSLLGTPLQTTTEMVRIDGRWYSKDTIDKLREREADSAAATSAPPSSGD